MAFLPGAMGRLGHTIKEHLDGSDAKSNASSIGDVEMVLLPPWGSLLDGSSCESLQRCFLLGFWV